MSIRHAVITCLGLLVTSPLLWADEKDDKLDAILKELQSLNERVSRLEKRVQSLTRQIPGQSWQEVFRVPVFTPPETTIQKKRAATTPEEVIRLQGESPGSLLKGLHERERSLRKRQFPAEAGFIYPSPLR